MRETTLKVPTFKKILRAKYKNQQLSFFWKIDSLMSLIHSEKIES